MIFHGKEHVRIIRHGHIACGIGAGAQGFNHANPRVGRMRAKFECAGGIDVDAGALENFERLTGVKGTLMDLFSRDQYEKFHGRSPPAGWVEAVPADFYRTFGPGLDVVFASLPCKGFSGLLSSKQSETDKYQALNALTLRSIWLLLEAYQGDQAVPIILFENVPRIATRGRWLLDQITGLLRHYGYEVTESVHDCGELGELAQSRKRFLLIARHPSRIPPFVYQPAKRRLRGVGEVIGKLPLPGDPVAGTMHRVPALQWKTWVRLAFVPAGKDWRALNDLAVENGVLRDYGIVPEVPLRDNALGVCSWGDTAPLVTGQRAPGQGRFSVADPRLDRVAHYNVYRVTSFDSPAGAVTSSRDGAVADPRAVSSREGSGFLGVNGWNESVGVISTRGLPTNGAYSIADIRYGNRQADFTVLGVHAWGDTTGSIQGKSSATNGAFSIADIRVDGHPKSVQLGVRGWAATAPCIKGDVSVGTGPYAVADERPLDPLAGNIYRVVPLGEGVLEILNPAPAARDYSSRKYKVHGYADVTRAVIGASTTGDGAFAIADIKLDWNASRHRNIMRITSFDEPAGTIGANAHSITGGQPCVADPRPKSLSDPDRSVYLTQGHYGVQAWGSPSGAVPAFAKNNNGPWSVADPQSYPAAPPVELPKPDDRLVCRIIARDGTWHRPFTTLDLAALQSIVDPEEIFYQDERGAWQCRVQFDLAGKSDATKREWIGNAVPSASARAIADEIGETILLADMGETFTLSTKEIWVRPFALAMATSQDQAAFRMDMQ